MSTGSGSMMSQNEPLSKSFVSIRKLAVSLGAIVITISREVYMIVMIVTVSMGIPSCPKISENESLGGLTIDLLG